MRRMFSEKQIQELIKGTKKDITTLVDTEGHDRFIEGDIEVETIEGVTKDYAKWSLSGSHLLIVFACSIADTTALTAGKLAEISLPQWIKDKIETLFASWVSVQSISSYNEDFTSQSISLGVFKLNNVITIRLLSNFTATKDRHFRYQVDFLIDND